MILVDNIVKWFNEHHTIRKILKQGVLAGVSAFLTIILAAQMEIVHTAPEYSGILVMLFALLNGLQNYIKHNLG